MDIDIEKRKEYYQKNKEKRKEYGKKYYQLNKEKRKEYDHLNKEKRNKYSRKSYLLRTLKKHGLTMDDHKRMLREQNNCCAICGKRKETLSMAMAIDHCHITGKVRGLLCRDCNVGIGTMRDSVELLKKAIEYLEKS